MEKENLPRLNIVGFPSAPPESVAVEADAEEAEAVVAEPAKEELPVEEEICLKEAAEAEIDKTEEAALSLVLEEEILAEEQNEIVSAVPPAVLLDENEDIKEQSAEANADISPAVKDPELTVPVSVEHRADIVDFSAIKRQKENARILAVPQSSPVMPNVVEEKPKKTCKMRFCMVFEGDDLFSLAERAGVAPALIAEKNDLFSAQLTAGQYLLMP